jgi:hypothetical protein
VITENGSLDPTDLGVSFFDCLGDDSRGRVSETKVHRAATAQELGSMQLDLEDKKTGLGLFRRLGAMKSTPEGEVGRSHGGSNAESSSIAAATELVEEDIKVARDRTVEAKATHSQSDRMESEEPVHYLSALLDAQYPAARKHSTEPKSDRCPNPDVQDQTRESIKPDQQNKKPRPSPPHLNILPTITPVSSFDTPSHLGVTEAGETDLDCLSIEIELKNSKCERKSLKQPKTALGWVGSDWGRTESTMKASSKGTRGSAVFPSEERRRMSRTIKQAPTSLHLNPLMDLDNTYFRLSPESEMEKKFGKLSPPTQDHSNSRHSFSALDAPRPAFHSVSYQGPSSKHTHTRSNSEGDSVFSSSLDPDEGGWYRLSKGDHLSWEEFSRSYEMKKGCDPLVEGLRRSMERPSMEGLGARKRDSEKRGKGSRGCESESTIRSRCNSTDSQIATIQTTTRPSNGFSATTPLTPMTNLSLSTSPSDMNAGVSLLVVQKASFDDKARGPASASHEEEFFHPFRTSPFSKTSSKTRSVSRASTQVVTPQSDVASYSATNHPFAKGRSVATLQPESKRDFSFFVDDSALNDSGRKSSAQSKKTIHIFGPPDMKPGSKGRYTTMEIDFSQAEYPHQRRYEREMSWIS